ncbi:MAG TPA: MotA/TolQ/ExbB proton channel family protein, partial [Candidatus Omnitrophota bacterium]|nr:MotA/TolQ/ExbB proton channel family protein [Candidatus Omnitrophota bacterium]
MNRLLRFLAAHRMHILVLVQAVMPILFVVASGFIFHEFVLTAVKGHAILNAGIMVVGLFGAGLMIYRLVEAQREHSALLRFGRDAQAGASMKDLMEEEWLQNRSMRRYLDHIAQTNGKLSSQLDQDAIENELHAIEADFDSKLELPNFLVGFMIAMGLLGTFIGLLETLTGISGMLDGMASSGGGAVEEEFIKLVGELRKPLAGMGIAFSASMFGLVG